MIRYVDNLIRYVDNCTGKTENISYDLSPSGGESCDAFLRTASTFT
ncbi:MAG: hypothetical protein ACI8S7_001873, partial [Candidatus Krumholzibacteriia bacterium]